MAEVTGQVDDRNSDRFDRFGFNAPRRGDDPVAVPRAYPMAQGLLDVTGFQVDRPRLVFFHVTSDAGKHPPPWGHRGLGDDRDAAEPLIGKFHASFLKRSSGFAFGLEAVAGFSIISCRS